MSLSLSISLLFLSLGGVVHPVGCLRWAGIVVAGVPSPHGVPNPLLGVVVLGGHPDVVRAVGMGFLASLLYASAGSPRPDMVHVSPRAFHPNLPQHGVCSPLGLWLLMCRFCQC